MAVWYIKHQRSSQTEILLSFTKVLLNLVHSCHILRTAQYLPGCQKVRVDALSWFPETSLEWHLQKKAFHSLLSCFSCLDKNLFMAPDSHLLYFYLTRHHRIEAEGPYLLTVNWNRGPFQYCIGLIPWRPPSFCGCFSTLIPGKCYLLHHRGKPYCDAVSYCNGVPPGGTHHLPSQQEMLQGLGHLLHGDILTSSH